MNPLRKEDLADIIKIAFEAGSRFGRVPVPTAKYLAKPGVHAYVLEDEETTRLVAFLIFKIEKRVIIKSIAVLPMFQRLGCGTALVQKLEIASRRDLIAVASLKNPNYMEFLKAMGFTIPGTTFGEDPTYVFLKTTSSVDIDLRPNKG